MGWRNQLPASGFSPSLEQDVKMGRSNCFLNHAQSCALNARSSDDVIERERWMKRAARWLQLAMEARTKADNEPLEPLTTGQAPWQQVPRSRSAHDDEAADPGRGAADCKIAEDHGHWAFLR